MGTCMHLYVTKLTVLTCIPACFLLNVNVHSRAPVACAANEMSSTFLACLAATADVPRA